LFRGHDKEFNDAGTTKKVFQYRQPLDVRFNLTGYNLDTGINVSALFSIRLISSEPLEVEGVIDHSIPSTMGQIIGHSASCLDTIGEVDRKDVLHVGPVHHQSSPFQILPDSLSVTKAPVKVQQGIVLSISITGLSSELYHTPLNAITSVSTVTTLAGIVSHSESRLCESIAQIRRYRPTITKDRLGSVSLCEDSILLGNLFYPNGRTTDEESPDQLHLLLHVPILWNSSRVNATGVGYYIHGNLELFLTSSVTHNDTNELITFVNETLRTTSLRHRLLCVGGVYRWGTRKMIESPLLLNQTNATSFMNLTSTNQTNSSQPSSSIDHNEPEPKVDTYASSLRHVNSLYHKVCESSLNHSLAPTH
jgi:hypothetical protein